MKKTSLAILWHQHQPYYLDALEQRFILPWVRLHAVKDYYGMARILKDHPKCHQTINLVPSLLAQLEMYIDGTATDRPLELAQTPAADLSRDEKIEILDFFFKANWERMIRPLPRYMELLTKRDPGVRTAADVADRFSANEMRDLQILFHLAWTHPLAIADYPQLGQLIDKERNYSEEDKPVLFEAHMEILRAIVPLHKELAEQGTLELTTTPFYHPILPLLCNTAAAHEAMPGAKLPKEKLDVPEDAEAQIAQGLAYFESRFGFRPKGMWPSEGSVSQEILPILQRQGIEWIATDEEVLYHSVATDGAPLERTCAYQTTPGVAAVFRDHKLSDKIGFHYHWTNAEDAVEDFIRGVHAVGASSRKQHPLVCVILDGENAWEHYPNAGMDFLNRLYSRIVEDEQIEPTTIGDYLAAHPPRHKLEYLFAGSWIDHNFAIWIGHAEDRKAWDYLGEARRFLVSRATEHPRAAEAWQALYAAEGSDWFWWYGDDHFSGMDDAFDRLFRQHLKNIYRYLDAEPPAFLDEPIAATGRPSSYTVPSAFMQSSLDGRISNYFEWLPAGRWAHAREGGAMERSGPGLISDLYFGFNAETLFLRVDATDRAALIEDETSAIRFVFLEPANLRLVIEGLAGSVVATLERTETNGKEVLPGVSCRAAADRIVETAVPFSSLGVAAGESIKFFVEALHGGAVAEKAPGGAPIELECPGPEFDQMMWSV